MAAPSAPWPGRPGPRSQTVRTPETAKVGQSRQKWLGVMVVPDPRSGGGHHRPRAGPGAVVTICSELVDITVEDSILSRKLFQ